mgnify:CR=1 FL=1
MINKIKRLTAGLLALSTLTVAQIIYADSDQGALEGDSTSSHYIDVVAKDDNGAWKIRLHSWSMTL